MPVDIDKHPFWRQMVMLMLIQKPDFVPMSLWRWMVKRIVAQEVNRDTHGPKEPVIPADRCRGTI